MQTLHTQQVTYTHTRNENHNSLLFVIRIPAASLNIYYGRALLPFSLELTTINSISR